MSEHLSLDFHTLETAEDWEDSVLQCLGLQVKSHVQSKERRARKANLDLSVCCQGKSPCIDTG